MSKILVVYGSTTGTTESVAESIGDVLGANGCDVVVKNVSDTSVEELGGEYDVTVLGTSTWGDDEIEFQEDFEPFYKELMSSKLKGKKIALFGCGDSDYEFFCGAVDLLEERMDELGATEIVSSLKIDGDPDDTEVRAWALSISSKLTV
ncbi:MAG: flavodoxin [Desulfotalea sp.]